MHCELDKFENKQCLVKINGKVLDDLIFIVEAAHYSSKNSLWLNLYFYTCWCGVPVECHMSLWDPYKRLSTEANRRLLDALFFKVEDLFHTT